MGFHTAHAHLATLFCTFSNAVVSFSWWVPTRVHKTPSVDEQGSAWMSLELRFLRKRLRIRFALAVEAFTWADHFSLLSISTPKYLTSLE